MKPPGRSERTRFAVIRNPADQAGFSSSGRRKISFRSRIFRRGCFRDHEVIIRKPWESHAEPIQRKPPRSREAAGDLATDRLVEPVEARSASGEPRRGPKPVAASADSRLRAQDIDIIDFKREKWPARHRHRSRAVAFRHAGPPSRYRRSVTCCRRSAWADAELCR